MFIIALILAQLNINQAYKTILFTRHGARSPKIYTEIDTNYLWTILPEDLTQIGLEQHMRLGKKHQRSDLYDLEGNCIYEQLEIQASTTARVVMSTIGFIKGLCPNNYVDILHTYFDEYYQQYSTDAAKFELIMNSDFSNPLELDVHYFEKPNDFMFHGHKKTVCPALKQIKKDKENSSTYTTKQDDFKAMNEFEEVAAIIKAAYPSQDIKKKKINLEDIEDIHDDYYSNSVQGFAFPNPSQAAVIFMQDVTKFRKYYVDNSDMVEHQSSLTEPFKWLISQLNSELPLSWYSGHDSNQVAILSVITDIEFIIPFASELEFIVDGEYVELYFNGVQLSTKFCSKKTRCTITQVTNYLSQFISSDLEKLCQVTLVE